MAASKATTFLMVMLLLAAVVATNAHRGPKGHKGQKVSCKNNTPVPIKVEGIEIAVGAVIDIDIVADIEIELFDKAGKLVKGTCHLPVDVTALVFVYVDLSIQVKVAAVSKLLGLLHTILGLVLTTIKCIL